MLAGYGAYVDRSRPATADATVAGWLLEAICARLGADPQAVAHTRAKTPRERLARREWFVALWASGWAFAHIGRVTGFDHTSVIYAVRKDGWR